jgi:arginyl-tRNA synthetase
MSLPEGKMSTRKGEIILLDEVIKEAASRAQILIESKSKELVPEERNRIAQAMAISAIKYNIISQNRETNITFDLDRMLSLDGNSAPYLQYTLARAQSILRKYAEEKEQKKAPKMPSQKNDFQTDLFSMAEAKILEENIQVTTAAANPGADAKAKEIPFTNEAELTLLHLFPHFPESVEHAVREYKPNIIANYLYELARAFNGFYDRVSVMSAADEELKSSRVKLVEAAANILRNGLTVLGISVFERM